MAEDEPGKPGAPPSGPQAQAAPAAPADAADEKKLRQELGIGGTGKVEIDQRVIDQLLGDAVVGYEEIFKGTVLESPRSSGATGAEPGGNRSGEEMLDHNLQLLRDVNMKVKVELGRGQMYLKDILTLGQGSVVELERLAGDPLEIFVNEKMIARGEVLVLNENFCIRITEIHDPKQVLARDA